MSEQLSSKGTTKDQLSQAVELQNRVDVLNRCIDNIRELCEDNLCNVPYLRVILDEIAMIGPMYERAAQHSHTDAVEALRPFVELYEKVDERYRKRGGNPDQFSDAHPFSDISAKDLPLGVWRRARTALRNRK